MPRLMSVAFTEQAVRDRTKTVTRRKGWWVNKAGARIIVPGNRLTLCRKVMGRKPGEPLERICDVEVVRVDREPLCALVRHQHHAEQELIREGFPGMDPEEFMDRYFRDAQGIGRTDDVTRIQWRYLEENTGPWRDNQGDVWELGADGLLHTPETRPFPREHVERKWGPLVPVRQVA